MKTLSVKKILYTIFFLMLTALILTNSQISLYYALNGLKLWFSKMIPSLLPFMMISGIMIRLHLTEGFASLLYPILYPVFHVSKNACYAMIMGFLCGFPMGAKAVSDLYGQNLLKKREAEYLLAFCNNIGPVYFVSFVLPLLHRRLILPYLFGMYGIPLLYGLFLRYSFYRELSSVRSVVSECEHKEALLYEIDEAVSGAVQSILSLGGYMILFNLLNLIPHVLTNQPSVLLAPIFEITGGIDMLKHRLPLYSLLVLPFGGFSCIAQTYSCLKHTDLSILKYTMHKLVLTLLTVCYYLLWLWISPSSFMR